jgi:hypothetical protein
MNVGGPFVVGSLVLDGSSTRVTVNEPSPPTADGPPEVLLTK